MDSSPSTELTIHTVSELNLAVRAILDEALEPLWIRGEISNFACPSSKHWYFTLKDAHAQVRCAMFRGKNMSVGFMPENGMEVVILAKAGLYPERGEFQLVAEKMQLSGEGQLQKAFEKMKKKLEAEGLFDPALKKPLPDFPQRVGVVTSPTGAAIRDILSVLARRFPLLEVIIYPTAVQGQQAAAQIVKAIRIANKQNKVDVLMVSRGGGSLEDLWPFNEESVARAIFASQLPVISGVGHETDFTIADYVADVRAPTPSAAAETISPDADALSQELLGYENLLTKLFLRLLQDWSQKIDTLEKSLGHPLTRLKQTEKELKALTNRLTFAQNQYLKHLSHKVHTIAQPLKPSMLLIKVQKLEQKLATLSQQHQQHLSLFLHQRKSRFHEAARSLHIMSPLATLDRGYSITMKQSKVLTSISQTLVGDSLETRLKNGSVTSRVLSIETSSDDGCATQ